MGDSSREPSPFVPRDAVGALRVVIEQVQGLWEREAGVGSGIVVSASQLRVLWALERTAGLSLRELGEVVGSAPSALSRLCARLEAMGLVRRAPSVQSGREIELYPTRLATERLQQVRDQREHALASALASMPPEALASLAEGVAGLRAVLEARARPADEAGRGESS